MIYLYWGENSFLIQEKLAKTKEKYAAKFDSGLNFFRFDLEESFEDLKSVLESQSMFAEKKLVFLRGVFSVSESKWEEINKILDSVIGLEKTEDIVLVAYDFVPAVSATLKKRLAFWAKKGKTEEFKNYDKPKLINWAENKAKELNLKIDKPNIFYLVNNLGTDIQRLDNELKKISAYKNGAQVLESDIDSLVNFEIDSNNFKVIDALVAKNPASALKSLEDQWQKNEDPILILGAIVWQFRILVKLAGSSFVSGDEAAKSLGISPWVAKKSLSAFKRFSLAELKNIYQNLADIDLAVKTGERDGREALADFVYSFLPR